MDTVSDVQSFLKGTETVAFAKSNGERVGAYRWIEETLVKLGYMLLGRGDRGLVRAYIQKVTGYSRSQVTRCIGKYVKSGHVRLKEWQRHSFPLVYTREDIALLAKTDELHDFPNGVAIKKILQRMAAVYRQKEYEQIAKISVTHIYNMRHSSAYLRLTKHYQKTKPTVVNLGERRKPQPNGKPGYLRVDTVHQGDLNREKGVYHINIIDEVTQFEFVGAVEKISEAYMLCLLEELIDCFPFVVWEFHSDNGSEYINGVVVDLLNRLLIKLTKSRSRHSNDNAQIESKNGSVIRKWMGYGYIDQKHAQRINRFYFSCFNKYLNYHRPCAYATDIVDHKGKVKKIYKQADYMTPYEKLRSLPKSTGYLKAGITFKQLGKIALEKTDNEMAYIVQEERRQLFGEIIPINL